MSIKEWMFVALVVVVTLGLSFFPAISSLYGKHKKDMLTNKQMIVFIEKSLELNGMKMEKSKNYSYDFDTNILTVTER